jgi:hypothetical protein
MSAQRYRSADESSAGRRERSDRGARRVPPRLLRGRDRRGRPARAQSPALMPAVAEVAHDRIEAVLGRPTWTHAELPLPVFSGSERILVTGGDGFLGRRVRDSPAVRQLEVGSLDLEDGYDVLDFGKVVEVFAKFEPTIVFHLAAHKDAPEGELRPGAVADLNVRGTQIVCDVADELAVRNQQPVRVVLASTCKAADPATAYGASKLIAERIVLNRSPRARGRSSRPGSSRPAQASRSRSRAPASARSSPRTKRSGCCSTRLRSRPACTALERASARSGRSLTTPTPISSRSRSRRAGATGSRSD